MSGKAAAATASAMMEKSSHARTAPGVSLDVRRSEASSTLDKVGMIGSCFVRLVSSSSHNLADLFAEFEAFGVLAAKDLRHTIAPFVERVQTTGIKITSAIEPVVVVPVEHCDDRSRILIQSSVDLLVCVFVGAPEPIGSRLIHEDRVVEVWSETDRMEGADLALIGDGEGEREAVVDKVGEILSRRLVGGVGVFVVPGEGEDGVGELYR